MRFQILGPLQVVDGDHAIDLGPLKQRSLLALLLINGNRTVSTSRILEELWGDEAQGKENALWVYVSRLRAALGDEPSPLVTRDGGYSLEVEPSAVDSLRFEAGAEAGHSALKDDPARAAQELREALALWRGEALEDFRYLEFAQAEIKRLEELRMTAWQDRIEADLRVGGSTELVTELDDVIASDPFAERPICLKMMALYRSGRQVEALQTYQGFRRTLGEEMGLEPSPELTLLEEQILLHDSRLQAKMVMPAGSTSSEVSSNPFKGLQAFEEADADQFFGRDRLVAEVIRRVGDEQLVSLIGPSGSGKSSVVRAGVIPAIRKGAIPGSDTWLVAQMLPGSRPFAELEAALLRSSIDAPASLSDQLFGDEAGILRAALRVLPDDRSKILIIIDQFEELFTLVGDGAIQERFLDGLIDAVDGSQGRVRLLLTLRADFYDRPLRSPAFGARMGDGVVNVVPMSPDELEHAAQDPAAQAGVTLEPALVASLLTDVIGQPGALPLFQYTLTELFEHRTGASLDLAAYQAIGGLRGTLSARADTLLGNLNPAQQAAARQLFLRLVTVQETDEWGRRRVPASEVIALDVDVADLKTVIDSFGSARLLTFDRDFVSGSPTVEVAHESLLTEWDRLRRWILAAREDIVRNARLASAAIEWRSSGENPDFLLSGSRLDEYQAWAGDTTLTLTGRERSYLDASLAQREATDAREADRDAREARLNRRAKRRLWGVVALLAVLGGIGIATLLAVLRPEPPTIALVGMLPDDMSQQFINGFESAARDGGFSDDWFIPTADPAEELADYLASEKPVMVITGFPDNFLDIYGETPTAVAARHPDITFVGFNFYERPLPNQVLAAPDLHEGIFLMGSAAALSSDTGAIGFIGPPGFRGRFFRTFRAGAEHVRGDVTVAWAVVPGPDYDAYRNPQPVYDAAESMYAGGADVVFAYTGEAGQGALEAAAEASAQGRHRWAIGADLDRALFADPSVQNHLLTSLVARRDLLIGLVIEAFLDGTLQPDPGIGIADGGIDYATTGNHLDPAVIIELERIKEDIISGAIAVP